MKPALAHSDQADLWRALTSKPSKSPARLARRGIRPRLAPLYIHRSPSIAPRRTAEQSAPVMRHLPGLESQAAVQIVSPRSPGGKRSEWVHYLQQAPRPNAHEASVTAPEQASTEAGGIRPQNSRNVISPREPLFFHRHGACHTTGSLRREQRHGPGTGAAGQFLKSRPGAPEVDLRHPYTDAKLDRLSYAAAPGVEALCDIVNVRVAIASRPKSACATEQDSSVPATRTLLIPASATCPGSAPWPR